MKSYELWFFPKMRKNKYLSPFTSLNSPFYFLEAVVGALPVAHEPSSFSFSLLLLSFTLVALSLVALDFALCLTKDRGGQCSLKIDIVSTPCWQITNSSADVAGRRENVSFQTQNLIFLPVSGIVFKSCTFAVSNIYRWDIFLTKSLGKTFKHTFPSWTLFFSGRTGGEAGGDVNERANEIAQLLK